MAVGLYNLQDLLVQVGAGNTLTTVRTAPAPEEVLIGPGDEIA